MGLQIRRRPVWLVLGALCCLGPGSTRGDERQSVEFTVASYNVHGIFVPDFSGCPFATRKYRFSRIADVANRYDVVLLQEFFRTKPRGDTFRGYLLQTSNHPYQDYHCATNRTTYDSGLGVLVGARLSEQAGAWTVTEYQGVPGQYSRCHGKACCGNDCFSTKGYGRLTIEILGQRLVIYVTHLDSGTTFKDKQVRVGQMQELAEAMAEDKAAGRAILLAGDFNTVAGTPNNDSLALEALRASLGLTAVDPGHSPFPAEHCGNWKLCDGGVIDHLFYLSGDQLELEVVDALWHKPRGGQLCSRLSDHPLLSATVRATRQAQRPAAVEE